MQVHKQSKSYEEDLESDIIENIPQLDGATANVEDKNYCKICKNSDEIESEEDLSFHMMNDHDPNEVLEIYGHNWIEERRHCIRKHSSFERIWK